MSPAGRPRPSCDGADRAPATTTTVLNALSAESWQEADDVLAWALASGGEARMPAQDHGSMYGVSFADPDGHVWEVVWTDPAAVR